MDYRAVFTSAMGDGVGMSPVTMSRRLAHVLPRRTLVEQTPRHVRSMVGNLVASGIGIGVGVTTAARPQGDHTTTRSFGATATTFASATLRRRRIGTIALDADDRATRNVRRRTDARESAAALRSLARSADNDHLRRGQSASNRVDSRFGLGQFIPAGEHPDRAD